MTRTVRSGALILGLILVVGCNTPLAPEPEPELERHSWEGTWFGEISLDVGEDTWLPVLLGLSRYEFELVLEEDEGGGARGVFRVLGETYAVDEVYSHEVPVSLLRVQIVFDGGVLAFGGVFGGARWHGPVFFSCEDLELCDEEWSGVFSARRADE